MADEARIALGTVQFGLQYGVNNRKGMVSREEVENILLHAWHHGIDMLDTAHAYGQSEETLGTLLEQSRQQFKIITKLDPVLELEESFHDSLRRLRKPKVHGFLVHSYADFERKPEMWRQLQELRRAGFVDRIGFSLYYPRELESLMAASADFDIVQFPFSVFDRRFEPYFSALRDMKVEMHVRSVFLQGLAFMDPAEVPRHLQDAVEKVRDLRAIAASSRASISSICLQFVLSRQEIDRVVIGVDSLENLQENLDALSAAEMTSQTLSRVDALVIHNENVTVPSNWRK